MNQLIGCFDNYVTSSARFSPPDFMNVYYQIRSSQLDRSIKGLKEHFCKNSASSGILYSPAVQTKRKDTPTKKAPKRPGEWASPLLRLQLLITRRSRKLDAHTTAAARHARQTLFCSDPPCRPH